MNVLTLSDIVTDFKMRKTILTTRWKNGHERSNEIIHMI